VGSRSEKSKLVRQLTEGLQQVFTATNALGLGVDAPTIRVVIHAGTVRRLREYAQESGRAGRDGLKSEAIILRGVSYDRWGKVQEGEPHGDVEDEMREFITTEGCRRVVLDRAMDRRRDRDSCEQGEERCNRCKARRVDGIKGIIKEEVEEAVAVVEEEDEGEEGEEAGTADGTEDEEGEERVEFERETKRRRLMGV
jgi:superfamily II DNA helicase RecQ